MPNLMVCGDRNPRERLPQSQRATQSAIPLDFERKSSSETQICARRRLFSAAC